MSDEGIEYGEICPEAPRQDGYPMRHDIDVKHGAIGDNGYPHETFRCIHCGGVAGSNTPEEVERYHVTDMIRVGEVTEDDLSAEALEKDWIQEALSDVENRGDAGDER